LLEPLVVRFGDVDMKFDDVVLFGFGVVEISVGKELLLQQVILFAHKT